MDIQKFLGTAFLKVAEVRAAGPIRVIITDICEGKYGKLDASFDDGTRLSPNVTNCRALARAYGTNSEDWRGKQIELDVGEVKFNDNPQEAVLVRPISPPIEKKPPPPFKKDGDGEMDDEIPF